MKGVQKVRFTLEEVQGFFNDRGYKLLDLNYEHSMQRMQYECPKHRDKETYITVNDLKNSGRGCVYCAGLNKPDFTDVIDTFDKLGLDVLETEYKNQRTKMQYRCRKHPDVIQSAIYKTIKKGHGCKLCGYEQTAISNTGEGNWNWNGGLSEIGQYLRKNIGDWKQKSLAYHDYRCVITGEKASDLEVHHVTPFNVIRDEVFAELNIPIYETIGEYTFEQLTALAEGVRHKHDAELGVPIRYHLHRQFHSLYGFKTAEADLLEFKTRYRLGELDEEMAV